MLKLYKTHGKWREIQYYSCGHNLGLFNISCGSSHESHCKNVSVPVGGVETKAELCCCFGDLCMTPPFNYSNSNIALNLTSNGTIWIADNKIEHPTPKNKKYTDWLFYGGLIAAALLIVLIIVAAIIVGVKCRKKKETNRLMLAYTQLLQMKHLTMMQMLECFLDEVVIKTDVRRCFDNAIDGTLQYKRWESHILKME
ncbi:unnamed protein product [Mytilus edulis]|uniref:Uncharacterized protein n=1 Tax=Mytilus edulis TaxID=6550 RepID=A0A8S3UN50_MYTED|nr:unnamed protein product [Mytilus edulis]